MLTLFLFFSLSISLLTFIVLKSDSSNKEDLRKIISLISINFNSLVTNIMKLILLLAKDILTSSDNINLSNHTNNLKDDINDKNETEVCKLKIDSQDLINEQDIDIEINQFSPEVIEIIDNEEKKVA